MAAPKKLKVYRTAAGFHDAYVAAPSQKAALEAWGSDHNLFARGVAEIVTDEKLTAEPLANPGQVIKKLRGTADEQMAALPEWKPSAKATTEKSAPMKPRVPRPSRRELDEDEQALADMEERHRREADALAEELAKLERQRRIMEKKQDAEREKLEAARDRSKATYDRAIEKWRA
jgi:hypothetical protein